MNGLLFWNLWQSYIHLGWERHRKTKIDSKIQSCGKATSYKLLQKGQHDIFNLCVGKERPYIGIHMLPGILSFSCLPGKSLVRVSWVQTYLLCYFLHCTIPSWCTFPFQKSPSSSENLVYDTSVTMRRLLFSVKWRFFLEDIEWPFFPRRASMLVPRHCTAISFWHCSTIR